MDGVDGDAVSMDGSLVLLAKAATVASCIVTFTPLPYVYHIIVTDGDSIAEMTKTFRQKMNFCLPYVFLYMSALFWTFYGYTTENSDILFINGLGVVCFVVYLAVSTYYIEKNIAKQRLEELKLAAVNNQYEQRLDVFASSASSQKERGDDVPEQVTFSPERPPNDSPMSCSTPAPAHAAESKSSSKSSASAGGPFGVQRGSFERDDLFSYAKLDSMFVWGQSGGGRSHQTANISSSSSSGSSDQESQLSGSMKHSTSSKQADMNFHSGTESSSTTVGGALSSTVSGSLQATSSSSSSDDEQLGASSTWTPGRTAADLEQGAGHEEQHPAINLCTDETEPLLSGGSKAASAHNDESCHGAHQPHDFFLQDGAGTRSSKHVGATASTSEDPVMFFQAEEKVKRRMQFSFLSAFNTTMVLGTLLFCVGVLNMNAHEDHAQKLLIQEVHHQKHLREEIKGETTTAVAKQHDVGQQDIVEAKPPAGEASVVSSQQSSAQTMTKEVSPKPESGVDAVKVQASEEGTRASEADASTPQSQQPLEGAPSHVSEENSAVRQVNVVREGDQAPRASGVLDAKPVVKTALRGTSRSNARASGTAGIALPNKSDVEPVQVAAAENPTTVETNKGGSTPQPTEKRMKKDESVSIVIKNEPAKAPTGGAEDTKTGEKNNGAAASDDGDTVLVIHKGSADASSGGPTPSTSSSRDATDAAAPKEIAGAQSANGVPHESIPVSGAIGDDTKSGKVASEAEQRDKEAGDIVVSIHHSSPKVHEDRNSGEVLQESTGNAQPESEGVRRGAAGPDPSVAADKGSTDSMGQDAPTRVAALSSSGGQEREGQARETTEAAKSGTNVVEKTDDHGTTVVVGKNEVTIKIGNNQQDKKVDVAPPSSTARKDQQEAASTVLPAVPAPEKKDLKLLDDAEDVDSKFTTKALVDRLVDDAPASAPANKVDQQEQTGSQKADAQVHQGVANVLPALQKSTATSGRVEMLKQGATSAPALAAAENADDSSVAPPLSWLQVRSIPQTSIEKEGLGLSEQKNGPEQKTEADSMLDSIPHIVVTSKTLIFSYLGIIFNIFVYIVPCAQLLDVIETGDPDLFPLPLLTAAGLVSNALWAEYSLKIHSIPYLIPNLIGVIFNFLQITVLCYFMWGAAVASSSAPPLNAEKILNGKSASPATQNANYNSPGSCGVRNPSKTPHQQHLIL
ncbi:unnamed protein product [Amoebophrya sp. A120]|nr:unnamed protein product [Amoebophrya sp. A120]|eukprot:GSA120T00002158001.1